MTDSFSGEPSTPSITGVRETTVAENLTPTTFAPAIDVEQEIYFAKLSRHRKELTVYCKTDENKICARHGTLSYRAPWPPAARDENAIQCRHSDTGE